MGFKKQTNLGTKRCIEVSIAIVLIVMLSVIVSAEEYAPQYGGSSSDNAYDYDFGEKWWETFWDYPLVDDSHDWYYTETDDYGILVFEIIPYGDGGDLDLYVWDYEAEYGELKCSSKKRGSSVTERCTVDKFNHNNWAFYIDVYNYDLGANFYADAYINSFVAECMRDSDCGMYQECNDYECEPLSCSEIDNGYDTCDDSEEGDEQCSGKTIERCWEFVEDETYCWMSMGSCTSEQECKESGDDAYCEDIPCDLTDAYWSKTTAKEGDTVTLTVKGTYCSGDWVDFEVNEVGYNPMGPAQVQPSSKKFSGSSVSSTWVAEWVNDFGTDPEYEFTATTDDDDIDSDNLLTVIVKQCVDFGLVSCPTEGAYKKENNKIYKCIDQYDWNWNEVYCWEPVSNLGDNDFCSNIQCSRNEWDCDYSSQCTTNRCTGSLICLGFECGCCNSNEDWDKVNNVCKLLDGESCTLDNQCYNGYCVHNKCASTRWLPNDGYCDESEGETCTNSVNDCKKCDLDSCTSASQCHNGYCVHNVCWHAPWKTGDGYCDSSLGENPSNSAIDCFDNLVVMDIIEAPTDIQQGQSFQVKAKLKNTGTYSGELKLEAGIEPVEWGSGYDISSEGDYAPMSYVHITKCCPGNSYYDAVKITLSPGEEEIVTFNLIAPTIHSIDACNNLGSAWGNAHTLVVGLYTACGEGYVNYQAQTIKIAERYCSSNSECNSNEYCMRNSSIQGVCRSGDNCINDCIAVGNSCEGTSLSRCGYFDNDVCLDKNVTPCESGKICVNGQCIIPVSITGLEMDYSGRNDITINKQPGDILFLNLIYKGTETVEIDYDSNYLTLSNCSKIFTITKNTQCILKVNNNALKKIYTVGIKNGKKGTLKVITPKTVIVTDRDRLIQRYGSEKEVTALMAEAYQLASVKEGVVYNLGDYLDDSMLWDDFTEYTGGKYK